MCLYIVIDDTKEKVVKTTGDRREAFDKAGEVWNNGGRGTVAKTPVD